MSNLLSTDKYKPAMALAGFPLRRETFTLSLRKGGPFLVPLDLEAWVRDLRPDATQGALDELASIGLVMPAAYRAAIAEGELEVTALPYGSWFLAGEPLLTVTGPSALVSTIEANVLAVQFRIQVATLARTEPGRLASVVGTVTCEREREIVLKTLDAAGVAPDFPIAVDKDGYYRAVRARARALLEVVEDPARLLEAGLRAASSPEQHSIAVRACRDAGFVATTDLALARELGMLAGGTTGHEHTQRWGTDYDAFTAVRDSLGGEVTYLLDTYATLQSGLPTAVRVMREDRDRAAAIRLDSEATMVDDYREAVAALRAAEIDTAICLGGGFDLARTRAFERRRRKAGWPAARQRYLYGQHLVAPHVPLPTRADVGAVYKLSQTGARATRKFSDDRRKASLPGRPVAFRLAGPAPAGAPWALVGQQGEAPPAGYRRAGEWPQALSRPPRDARIAASRATTALLSRLEAERLRSIARSVA